MLLHHSHVTSGFAGLRSSRSLKQENAISSGHAQSLLKEYADRVVGPGALIVEVSRDLKASFFEPSELAPISNAFVWH